MNRVLITGAAGFIGYHLANHLLKIGGYTITLVDDFSRGERDEAFEELLKHPNIIFVEADLSRMESWEALGGGFKYVYHLAAVNGTRRFYEIPHEVLRIDALATLFAVEWMRLHNKEGKLLFTSTCEAYAGAREAFESLPIPTPENVPLIVPDVLNPRWSYAGSKIIGELFCVHYAKEYGFPMVIVRPHNFYGPREGYEHVLPELILRAIRKEDPFLVFNPEHKRSFLYIDDAVEAMRLVMESPRTDNGIYNIGSPDEHKVLNIAETLFRLFDWTPKLNLKESHKGSVKRRVPDLAKLERDIDWRPTTSFDDGVKKQIEWYRMRPEPLKRQP